MGYDDVGIESGNEKFLIIKAGEISQFHILSPEPKKIINHWIKGKKSECQRPNCELCDSGDQPRKGFSMEVYDRTSKKRKTYECGNQVMGQIKEIASILRENNSSIFDVDIRIKREGSSQFDTEYFVNQVPMKEPIPDGLRTDEEVPF